MFPTRYGPAVRRPGLKFVAEVKDSSKVTRLLPFKYSTVQAYILETGDEYLRFYKDRGQIVYFNLTIDSGPAPIDFQEGVTLTGTTSGATCIVESKTSSTVYVCKYMQGTFTDGEVISDGTNSRDCGAGYPITANSNTPVEISSSYLEADLFGIQRIQSADVMYGFHSNYNPRKLMRHSHDHWDLQDIVFDWPPFLDSNTENITLTFVGASESLGALAGNRIAHYKMNDDAANTTVTDESGSYDGTAARNTNLLSSDGKINATLNFNGTSDKVDLGNSVAVTAEFSVACWVKMNNFGVVGKSRPFISDWNTWSLGSQKGFLLRTYQNEKHPRFTVCDGTNYYGVISTEKLALNTWHHIVGTFEADTTFAIYVDGVVTTATPPSAYSREAATSIFMGYSGINAGYFDGAIDNVVIFDKALSQAEVDALRVETLTSSQSLFTSSHVGSYWLLKHPRTADEATVPNKVGSAEADDFLDADGEVTDWLKDVKGPWKVKTAGVWSGQFLFERSYDEGATSHTLETLVSNNTEEVNFNVEGNEEEGDAWLRARMLDNGSIAVAGDCEPTLTCERFYHYGIFKVTAFTSATVVTGEVVRTINSESATKLWSEGAWSDERGYPSTGTFHEERLMTGGTQFEPHSIKGSRTADWENFRTDSKLADDSISYSLAANEMNAVRWLISKEVLLLGTAGAEWKLGSFDSDQPLTPGNPIKPRVQTTYGSKDIQAIMLANIVLFVQAEGKAVRGAQYIFDRGESGGYDAPDYTTLANHITESGIVSMAYQQQPEPVLWCVLDNGNLIGMTFEPGEKVWGWFNVVTDGLVKDVAVIPGVSEDEVWVIVERTIDGDTKKYIEYFTARDWGSDQADCFFVDSGLSFDGGDPITITGLTKANPAVVSATANGFSDGDQVKIVGVAGMIEINSKVFTVASAAADTVALKDKLNTIDWSTLGEDYTAFASSVTGDVKWDSYEVTGVSTADIAKLATRGTVTGTGIPSDTTITAIGDDSFTMSEKAIATNDTVTITAKGRIMQVDNAFSGLDHLEGKTVSVLGDGSVHDDVIVRSGAVTLTDYFNKVHIGLPYKSKLQPMKLEIPGANIRGRVKRVHKSIFSFEKTLGARFGMDDGSKLDTIPFRVIDDTTGDPPPLFTGEKEMSFPGGYQKEGNVYVEQDQPLPMSVRSITARLAIYE